jgi:hypothetical protein
VDVKTLIVLAAFFIGLPLLATWFLRRFAPRKHGGTGWTSHGTAGAGGFLPYDVDAGARSVREILGNTPTRDEIESARGYLLQMGYDPTLLPGDLREQLGLDWTEHPTAALTRSAEE